MTRLLPLLLLFLFPAADTAAASQSLQTLRSEGAKASLENKSNGILVMTKQGSVRSALRGLSWKRVAPGIALVENAGKIRAKDLLEREGVLLAESNDYVQSSALSLDPMSYRMWSFENRNKKYYARSPYAQRSPSKKKKSIRDSDIDLAKAWTIEQGEEATKIAVIDTGIDPYHPDLKNNLWVNEDEIADNDIDDDGNGLVDDVHGWNFYDNNNQSADVYGHGTHVAGTIGAETDNRKGIAGINKRVSIINAKVLSDSGWGTDASIINGVLYAIENGARVISGSLGGPGKMPILQNIVRSNPEVLFVFASGNSAENVDKSPTYPCRIQAKNNICVASTNAQDKLSGFSNYSKRNVHIAAPGEDILSLIPFTLGCPGAPNQGCLRSVQFDMYEAPFSGWTHGGTNDTWGQILGLGNIFAGQKVQALSDSPGGKYAANSNAWALSPVRTIPSPSASCVYQGAATGRLEDVEDSVRVSLSTDGGATFKKVGAWSGKLMMGIDGLFEIPFKVIYENLPDASGKTEFQIKYTLTSDGDTEYDGATIFESTIYCQGSLANVDVYSGTSMAAPHVSGVAALLFSHKPRANAVQVKTAILRGADKKKSLRSKVLGAKRLNAWGALRNIR